MLLQWVDTRTTVRGLGCKSLKPLTATNLQPWKTCKIASSKAVVYLGKEGGGFVCHPQKINKRTNQKVYPKWFHILNLLHVYVLIILFICIYKAIMRMIYILNNDLYYENNDFYLQ